MNRPQPNIAVVGAGPAGLAAAFRLQRAGASVSVFEARPWVGARTRTDVIDGYRIDTFAQLFGSMYSEFFRTLAEIGGAELAVRAPGRDALWRGGRAHEVVYGSVTSMLVSGSLPLRTKMQLGTTYVPFLSRHADVFDIHSLDRAVTAGFDRESIAAWGERELGRDFVDYLAYPLLAAYYGATPEQTSDALYHMLAHHGMDVSVYALRGGAGSFCERLAALVREGGGEIHLSAAVQRVEAGNDGVWLGTEKGERRFDGVVVALAAPEAARITAGSAPAAAEWFAGVRYHPLLSVALLLDSPADVRYFGLSFPREESRIVAALCVEENKLPELVPPGRGLVVVLPAPGAIPELLDAEPQRVLDAVLPEIRRALPRLERSLRRVKVYRWPEGGPIFYPGYLHHLRAFREGRVEGDRAIVFAGDYLQVPATEGSVVSGRLAAERLISRGNWTL